MYIYLSVIAIIKFYLVATFVVLFHIYVHSFAAISIIE